MLKKIEATEAGNRRELEEASFHVFSECSPVGMVADKPFNETLERNSKMPFSQSTEVFRAFC